MLVYGRCDIQLEARLFTLSHAGILLDSDFSCYVVCKSRCVIAACPEGVIPILRLRGLVCLCLHLARHPFTVLVAHFRTFPSTAKGLGRWFAAFGRRSSDAAAVSGICRRSLVVSVCLFDDGICQAVRVVRCVSRQVACAFGRMRPVCRIGSLCAFWRTLGIVSRWVALGYIDLTEPPLCICRLHFLYQD